MLRSFFAGSPTALSYFTAMSEHPEPEHEARPNDEHELPDWLEQQIAGDFSQKNRELNAIVIENERDIGKFLIALNSGGLALHAALIRDSHAGMFAINAMYAFFGGIVAAFGAVAVNAWRYRHARFKFGRKVTCYHKGILTCRQLVHSKPREFWSRCLASLLALALVASSLMFAWGCYCTIEKLSQPAIPQPSQQARPQTGTGSLSAARLRCE